MGGEQDSWWMNWKNSCNGAGCRRSHKSAGNAHKRTENPGDLCMRRADAAGSGMKMQRGAVLVLCEGQMLAEAFNLSEISRFSRKRRLGLDDSPAVV